MRKIVSVAIFTACLLLGCGGGGGGGGGVSTAPTPSGPNVATIVVDAGLRNIVNIATTSVTLCVVGTNQCQIIDHILVDTGSVGLRIISSALSLPLQQQLNGGDPVGACEIFGASSYSWGPVKIADVKIAGEVANAVPIHIIEDLNQSPLPDPNFATTPANCISQSLPPQTAANTTSAFGANGILGIGIYAEDCGSLCALATNAVNFRPQYFTCIANGSCQPVSQDLAQQIQNPVALFPVDNNGVAIKLPAVAEAGAPAITGSLIFGINTQSNNRLGSATVYAVNSSGQFKTVYGGNTYNGSFIDSGSNALFFYDANITLCSNSNSGTGFYCPPSTLNLTAINQDTAGGNNTTIRFSVANTANLINNNPTHFVFSNLAGSYSAFGNSFDWGLPFFFGREVFTAIDNRATPNTNYVGPYVAY